MIMMIDVELILHKKRFGVLELCYSFFLYSRHVKGEGCL